MQKIAEALVKTQVSQLYLARKAAAPSAEMLEDIVKASQVLTDTTGMSKHLKALDKAMFELYAKRVGDLTRKEARDALLAPGRKSDDPSRHLLSEVLTEFEQTVKLGTYTTVNGHPRTVQMMGLLSGNDFLKVIEGGTAWKDYVTAAHGVYTHRIQWYCLHASGEFADRIPQAFERFGKAGPLPWTYCFDLISEISKAAGAASIDSQDFRNPENLHAHLNGASSDTEYPMLGGYIKAKTAAVKGKSWATVRKYVAARKLFPHHKDKLAGWKSFDKTKLDTELKAVLTPDELALLTDFLTEPSRTPNAKPQKDGRNVLFPDKSTDQKVLYKPAS